MIDLLKTLPTNLIEYIFFMANHRLDNNIKKELKLKVAHMMCKKHYDWWHIQLSNWWIENRLDDNYYIDNDGIEFPKYLYYDYSFVNFFTNCEINFIKENLLQCGCCERHASGIYKNKPHCLYIKQEKKNRICNCFCRHILRKLI